MSLDLDRDDLIVEFSKDGYHVTWQGDADTAAVFTPDGDHLATFECTPSGGHDSPGGAAYYARGHLAHPSASGHTPQEA